MAKKKVINLTPKTPVTMGDYIMAEAEHIFPDHARSIYQMIDDICPTLLTERYREEIRPQVQQLVFMVVTKIIEQLTSALLESAYDEARVSFVKKTGTPLKRIK